jgi:hypothetical protein
MSTPLIKKTDIFGKIQRAILNVFALILALANAETTKCQQFSEQMAKICLVSSPQ